MEKGVGCERSVSSNNFFLLQNDVDWWSWRLEINDDYSVKRVYRLMSQIGIVKDVTYPNLV